MDTDRTGGGANATATSAPGAAGSRVTLGTHLAAGGGALLNFMIVFFGGFFIGFVGGVVTALITKFTKLREHPLLETGELLACTKLYVSLTLLCVSPVQCSRNQPAITYN